jgi:hypothetical protein
MEYFLVGLGVTAALGALVWGLYLAVEGSKAGVLIIVVWSVLLFSFVAWSGQKEKGPCFEYETGVRYNPATKTMMPYRKCVDRGEWVTQ